MKDISIIMPVLNETWSLKQVTDVLVEENRNEILEIIIPIHPEKTFSQSKFVIEELKVKYGQLIKVVEQDLPFIGGAIRKGFESANGKYCLMMASDLETDPKLVKEMITQAHSGTADIITASRWLEGGGFDKYHPFKKLCNRIFQSIFSLIYFTKLSDMTYGFRIIRTDLIKKIQWQELRHPIFFETLLKPIRLGFKVCEIPAKWEARQEGESQISIWDYLGYCKIGLKLRFAKIDFE